MNQLLSHFLCLIVKERMELKVGVLTLQSKAVPRMNKSYMNGLRLAFSDASIDAKIVMEGVGDGTDVNSAVEKMEKLVMQEEVQIIVGMIGHRSAPSIRAATKDLWLPVIISDYGANLPVGMSKSEGFYSLSLDRWHSNYLLGEYLVKNTTGQVAVAASYYDCGYGLTDSLERGLYKAGGSFLGHYIVPHEPRENEAEIFIEHVANLEENPLFAVHSGLFAMEFGQSMEALGVKRTFPMYATAETISDKVLSEYGKYYVGTKAVTSWANELNTPDNLTFIEKYKGKYKKVPDEFALLGYETGLVTAAAVTSIDEDEMDEDAIIEALAKVKTRGPRGEISFNELNRCDNDHYLMEIVESEEGYIRRQVETLKPDTNYYSDVCHEEDSGKRGGWFNAYLCH